MLNVNVSEFAFICFHLEKMQSECLFDPTSQTLAKEEKEWRELVQSTLQALQVRASHMGLDATVGQSERIEKQVARGTSIGPLCYLLRDLEATTVRELKKPTFLMLRQDLSEFYSDEDEPVFGEAVSKKFRKAIRDIGEARRCLALERWDACVHHLMVATEHALRRWAKNLKLSTKRHIDDEEQRQILDAAEKQRKALVAAPKTKARDAKLQYVSETLGHFGFIKDAYRNYSAHGKERYDERRARNLMNHIEAFMRLLAADA